MNVLRKHQHSNECVNSNEKVSAVMNAFEKAPTVMNVLEIYGGFNALVCQVWEIWNFLIKQILFLCPSPSFQFVYYYHQYLMYD